jgi:hypothetical protein
MKEAEQIWAAVNMNNIGSHAKLYVFDEVQVAEVEYAWFHISRFIAECKLVTQWTQVSR